MSEIARSAGNEFVYGGHVAALVLPSMILAFALVNGDPLNLPLLAIAYLIPLIVYSFNYYAELEGDRPVMPERSAYLEKRARRYPYLISFYAGLLSALIVLYAQRLPELGVMVGALVVAGILYTAGLKRLTRHIPAFKTTYVAAEWAAAATLLYPVYAGRGLETAPVAFFGFVFIKVAVNSVFYDLKDIGTDGRDGLKTVPVVLGRERTIRWLYLLSLLAPVPLLAGVLAGDLPGAALILAGFTGYDFYYLRRAQLASHGGMTSGYYALADYEFPLWPLAAAVGLALLEGFGPVPLAALVVLINVPVLFEWRHEIKKPELKEPQPDAGP
ncbi:MAG TPA: UbiA family prenyltransferase [Methanocella sp.]|nr:UbiA family prenyltransferase [Methanocella sp.]